MTTTKEKATRKKSSIAKPKTTAKDKNRYIEAIGRRKTATARVRIFPSTSKPLKETARIDISINDKKGETYFPVERLTKIVFAPFTALKVSFKTTVKTKGGGPSAQAEAIRLGLSRALTALNEKWHTPLKAAGFLKRDPRQVERKKPGLRKARRPQQWRKR